MAVTGRAKGGGGGGVPNRTKLGCILDLIPLQSSHR